MVGLAVQNHVRPGGVLWRQPDALRLQRVLRRPARPGRGLGPAVEIAGDAAGQGGVGGLVGLPGFGYLRPQLVGEDLRRLRLVQRQALQAVQQGLVVDLPGGSRVLRVDGPLFGRLVVKGQHHAGSAEIEGVPGRPVGQGHPLLAGVAPARIDRLPGDGAQHVAEFQQFRLAQGALPGRRLAPVRKRPFQPRRRHRMRPVPGGPRLLRFRLGRVRGTGRDARRSQQQGRHRHPGPGLFPAQGVADAGLDPALPEGQGAGTGETSAHGEGEQGLAVGPAAAAPAQHRLVAAHLHVPAHPGEGQPDQGVEPVEAEDQIAQQLHQMVPPGQVEALVGQHTGQALPLQPVGEIDPGPQEAQQKRGAHQLRLPDVCFQTHGGPQTAAQAEVAPDAPEQHGRRAREPEQRPQIEPDLHRVGAGLGVGGGQDPVHRRAELRDRQGHGGLGCQADVCGDVLQAVHRAGGPGGGRKRRQVEDAEHAAPAHRAQQPEARRRPEPVGILLRRTTQGQAQQQHRADHHGPGDAQVQDRPEQLLRHAPGAVPMEYVR